jgi:hypothetical protein
MTTCAVATSCWYRRRLAEICSAILSMSTRTLGQPLTRVHEVPRAPEDWREIDVARHCEWTRTPSLCLDRRRRTGAQCRRGVQRRRTILRRGAVPRDRRTVTYSHASIGLCCSLAPLPAKPGERLVTVFANRGSQAEPIARASGARISRSCQSVQQFAPRLAALHTEFKTHCLASTAFAGVFSPNPSSRPRALGFYEIPERRRPET